MPANTNSNRTATAREIAEGLSPAQRSALTFVEQYDGRAIPVDVVSAHRHVSTLAAAGLVRIGRDRVNPRAQWCELTDLGRAVAAVLQEFVS